jgi:hypothetical protein
MLGLKQPFGNGVVMGKSISLYVVNVNLMQSGLCLGKSNHEVQSGIEPSQAKSQSSHA